MKNLFGKKLTAFLAAISTIGILGATPALSAQGQKVDINKDGINDYVETMTKDTNNDGKDDFIKYKFDISSDGEYDANFEMKIFDCKPNIAEYKLDYDGDNKYDMKINTKVNFVGDNPNLEADIDIGNDGIIDQKAIVKTSTGMVKATFDENNDGEPDETTLYQNLGLGSGLYYEINHKFPIKIPKEKTEIKNLYLHLLMKDQNSSGVYNKISFDLVIDFIGESLES